VKDRGQTAWESSLPSLHRLTDRPPLVERTDWLEAAARSKSLIHLGFVDAERTADKTAAGTWLHERLAACTAGLIGIDVDPAGVEAARAAGYEAYSCDLEDADAVAGLELSPAQLVIAGELLEHLDCPGRFFEAVKPLVAAEGALILTTPNATSLTNVLLGLSRREWTSPHHVAMYSWRVLATLLARHDWTLRDVAFYYRGSRFGPEAKSKPALAAAYNVYERASRPLLRLFPCVADGLIATATRSVG
jgi:SAM-dependent methyltransferase